MNRIIIEQIDTAIAHAEKKHGPMPDDKFFQIVKVTEELGEMANIANDLQEKADEYTNGDVMRMNEEYYLEILDTIAVLVRSLEALR